MMNKQLSLILNCVCKEIQLSDEQIKKAEKIYEDLSKYLQESNTLKSKIIDIFVQGSVALQTTVKPLKKDEFDLDIVCVFEYSGEKSEYFRTLIINRLKQSSVYRELLEESSEHKRNVCLKFGNTFHVDIVPAVKYEKDILLIPSYNKTTNLFSWKKTNPIGFRNWFFEQAKKQKYQEHFASKDEFPQFKEYESMFPLQNVIQLIKRWRDNKNLDDIKSILLTTIIGNGFDGEQNLFVLLKNTVDYMLKTLTSYDIRIENPSLPEECLSEKINKNPNTFNIFRAKLQNLKDKIEILQNCDLENINKILEEVFDENVENNDKKIIKKAFDEYGKRMKNYSDEGKMRIDTKMATISIFGKSGKKFNSGNNFYGS